MKKWRAAKNKIVLCYSKKTANDVDLREPRWQ
jgi:hypothetical protein